MAVPRMANGWLSRIETRVPSAMHSTKPRPARIGEARKVLIVSPESLEKAGWSPPPSLFPLTCVGLVPSGAMAQIFMPELRALPKAIAELSAAQLGFRSEAALLVSRVTMPPIAGVL